MKTLKFCLLLFLIGSILKIYGEPVKIINKKAGNLHKEIKKDRANTLTSLKIQGKMNQKDFKLLKDFQQIEDLDLWDVEFNDAKIDKKDFVQYVKDVEPDNSATLVLPFLPNLRSLVVPAKCRIFAIENEGKDFLSIESLTLPPDCAISDTNLKVKSAYILTPEEHFSLEGKNSFSRNYVLNANYINNPSNSRILVENLIVNSREGIDCTAANYF